MAVHDTLSSLAVEVIEEYLATSKMCLGFRKRDGGCLGYPLVLLLFCVTNALATYLKGDNVIVDGRACKITTGEPFLVLNHTYMGLQLSRKEIKHVERRYRNALAHNAVIDRGSVLVQVRPGAPDVGPFLFQNGVVAIEVGAFYRCVLRAWESFPKDRILTWEIQRPDTRALLKRAATRQK